MVLKSQIPVSDRMADNVVAGMLAVQRRNFIADRVKDKEDMSYVEEKERELLSFRRVGGRIVVSGDRTRHRKLKGDQEVEETIKRMFFDVDEEEEYEEHEFVTDNDDVEIPKLFCQIGDKANGWKHKNVRDATELYLSIMGGGKGGRLSLGDKTKPRSAWFDIHVWPKFQKLNKASMEEMTDIIKGIFSYFNLKPKIHCRFPLEEQEEQDEQDEQNEQDEQEEQEEGEVPSKVAEDEVEDEDEHATVAEGTVEEEEFQDGDVPTEVAEEQGKEQEQEEEEVPSKVAEEDKEDEEVPSNQVAEGTVEEEALQESDILSEPDLGVEDTEDLLDTATHLEPGRTRKKRFDMFEKKEKAKQNMTNKLVKDKNTTKCGEKGQDKNIKTTQQRKDNSSKEGAATKTASAAPKTALAAPKAAAAAPKTVSAAPKTAAAAPKTAIAAPKTAAAATKTAAAATKTASAKTKTQKRKVNSLKEGEKIQTDEKEPRKSKRV